MLPWREPKRWLGCDILGTDPLDEIRRTLMARTKTLPVPEVGAEAPEFHLPSAQGGQLRLSMRTARGPVVVVFYSGGWSAEDVAYFKNLAAKEDEINLAEATIVGIGMGEFASARDFVRETGIKSYILYDYAGAAARSYGLLENDEERGEKAERTGERKRLSPEEREKRRAERRASREDAAKGKSDGEPGSGSDEG